MVSDIKLGNYADSAPSRTYKSFERTTSSTTLLYTRRAMGSEWRVYGLFCYGRSSLANSGNTLVLVFWCLLGIVYNNIGSKSERVLNAQLKHVHFASILKFLIYTLGQK